MPRSEILSLLRTNRDALLPHFDLSTADLDKTYAPGKWKIRQILSHLADCEANNLWRLHKALAEPGSGVELFEENLWADELNYLTRPIALSKGTFLSSRNMLSHYIETMSDDILARECVHPQKGRVNGWRWAEINGQHCHHHLGQVEAALAGREWKKVETPGSWQFTGGKPPA